MMKLFDHTVAAAAKADAVSSCAASSRSMIAIIMDAIMASIFVAIISIIGTIPYGGRGVQNGGACKKNEPKAVPLVSGTAFFATCTGR